MFVPRRVTRLRIYLRRSSKWGRKDRLNRYLVYTYYCGEGGSLIDRVCATAEEADIGKGGGGGGRNLLHGSLAARSDKPFVSLPIRTPVDVILFPYAKQEKLDGPIKPSQDSPTRSIMDPHQ